MSGKMGNGGIRFGIITTNRSIFEGAGRILREEGQEVQVATVSLDEAIPAGKAMEEDGVEVILSWRGTANLLRESLRIPVLSFPQTSLDLLACLKDSSGRGEKILLPVFRLRLRGMEILEGLLKVKLVQMVYHDRASLEEVVRAGAKEGCQIVIGGGSSVSFAKKHGLKGIEMQVSEDLLLATIENARSVVRSNREEQEKAERYRCIINSVSEGIIAVDKEGRITTINEAARAYLKCPEQNVVGWPVARLVPEAPIAGLMESGQPLMNSLEKIKDEQFVFNHIPVIVADEVVGGVSTFRDISNIMKAENKVRESLTRGLSAKYYLANLIYKSKVMQEVVGRVRRFAQTDSTVLITGETGTGKEIIAQSVHNLSRRSRFPFVSINCAALPEQLLESELFGYEEGAFTGSKKGGKPGLFEMAHLGTVFLDEVASMPPCVQVRLLRVLQENEVRRLGGDRVIPVDVRILAAVNRDLEVEMREGRFREDLFYRFNVLQISIPPLRERSEDIQGIASAFIQSFSAKYKLNPIVIPADCMKKMAGYFWPGNVRQLRNFIERLVVLCNASFGRPVFEELYGELWGSAKGEYPPEEGQGSSLKLELTRSRKETEAEILKKALEQARFSKGKAAEILGISRTTLWKKLKEVEGV